MSAAKPRRKPERVRESTVANPRCVAILDAATELFLRHGYRRTSMDLLATTAGVAKPTLYAHFKDKNAVFRAVVERVMTTIVVDARAAAARRGGLAARLTGVLAAKFSYLFALLHDSPHAAELLDSQSRLGAEAVGRGDDEVRAILAGLVADAVATGELDLAPAGIGEAALVRALFRIGHGADLDADSRAGHRRHIGEMVTLLLIGVAARNDRGR